MEISIIWVNCILTCSSSLEQTTQWALTHQSATCNPPSPTGELDRSSPHCWLCRTGAKPQQWVCMVVGYTNTTEESSFNNNGCIRFTLYSISSLECYNDYAVLICKSAIAFRPKSSVLLSETFLTPLATHRCTCTMDNTQYTPLELHHCQRGSQLLLDWCPNPWDLHEVKERENEYLQCRA